MDGNNIQIVNQNGKIVGIDSDTGERVPIHFNDLYIDSADISESRTNSRKIPINVPTEFDTVSDAINEIKQVRVPPGVNFEIIIESGHQWQSVVEIRQNNLSHITITSEDERVTVAEDYDSVFILRVEHMANGPLWNVLLDGEGQSNVTSSCYRVRRGSNGYIAENSGFMNFPEAAAISCRGSSILVAENAVATGCRRGISIGEASLGYINGSDLSDSNQFGIRSTNCVLIGSGVTLSDCRKAFNLDNASLVRLDYATISGGDTHSDLDQGSIATFRGSVIEDTNGAGIIIWEGSKGILRDVTIQNNDHTGLWVAKGSEAVITNSTIKNNTKHGVRADEGGRASIIGCQMEANGTDIQCDIGSIITAYDTITTESTGDVPHKADMNIEPNTVEGNGIIFSPEFESD